MEEQTPDTIAGAFKKWHKDVFKKWHDTGLLDDLEPPVAAECATVLESQYLANNTTDPGPLWELISIPLALSLFKNSPTLKGTLQPTSAYETGVSPYYFTREDAAHERLDAEAEVTACLSEILKKYMTAHGLDTLSHLEMKDGKIVLHA
jgi:hypothetical protein